MRIIHGDVYTDDELVDLLSTIHLNLITAMKILLHQAKRLQISGKIIDQQSIGKIQSYIGNTSFLSPVLLTAITVLWADPVIQSVWGLREEFNINQSVSCLFDKCDLIATPGYMPESSDILHCSLPTKGAL